MPTINDLGFSEFQTREIIPIDLNEQIIELNQILSESGIDYNQLNINTFYSNQDMQTSNFVSGSAGWQLTGAGILTATGAIISGSLIAGEIHIPDEDTTASSFHVDTTGAGWVGATTTNRATAPMRWNATGALTVTSITISGLQAGSDLDGQYVTTNSITATQIAANTITADQITANTITAAEIAASTITTDEIAATTIVAGNISSNTITGNEISGTTLSGIFANLGSITAGSISVITGGNTVGLTPASATAIFSGPTGSPTFTVSQAGVLTSTSALIGGFTIAATTIADNATPASANILIDSSNNLMRLGPTAATYITLDGANQKIDSSDYSANNAGWHIGTDRAEFSNAHIRGELTTAVLTYNQKTATAGSLLVAKSGGVLKTDVTSVASPTTFNVDIEDPAVGHTQLFAVSDVLILQSGTVNNWVTVSSVSDETTFYRYAVVLQNGAASTTFYAGTGIIDYGATGQGFLEMSADLSNAPWYSVKTHAGSPWTTVTEHIRLGNLNGLADISSDYYGLYVGDYSAGQFLTYDSGSGYLIVNNTNLLFNNIFGDGSDGDVTISADTNLTSDMFYNDLTINDGYTLNPSGYRVFVRNVLTTNTTGKIARNGNNGSDAADTAGYSAGGAGGAALADGSIMGAVAGSDGGNGANIGSASRSGDAGIDVAKSLGSDGAAGGDGGRTSAPDVGGIAGVKTGTVFNKVHNVISAYLQYDFLPAGDNLKSSAGSGGGGGGDSANSGGEGAGGGGAGSPGGIVSVYARVITGTGTISANGGNGGDGGSITSSNGNGGTGGGGAGGSGGVVLLVYAQKSAITTQVTAGSGGAKGAHYLFPGNPGVEGKAGTAGNAGETITLQV